MTINYALDDRIEALPTMRGVLARPGARIVVSTAHSVSPPDGSLLVRIGEVEAHVVSAVQSGGQGVPLAAELRALAGDRSIATVVAQGIVDEHPFPVVVLQALREIAVEWNATILVDAANIAHEDRLLGLVTGRWGRCEVMPTFTGATLERWLGEIGLVVVARQDEVGPVGDLQTDGSLKDPLAGCALDELLKHVRQGADPWSRTRTFVWTCVAAEEVEAPGTSGPDGIAIGPDAERAGEPFDASGAISAVRPFLSVVMRTQGSRLHCLAEALTCLSGQTDQDFEVLVLGHRLTNDAHARVESVIEDQSAGIRSRTRLVRVEREGRSAPLNAGFQAARGRYIVILDDDDLPLAHWVETFHSLEAEAPGRILRTICVLQDVDHVEVQGRMGVRATGPTRAQHPSTFDMLQHLEGNYTPNTGMAFPAAVYHRLGIRFDETLSTTEDWDFMMRSALVVGVQSRAEITCVYRWWTSAESSRTAHLESEWAANLTAILEKFNAVPLVLGPGTAGEIRRILLQRHEMSIEAAHAQSEVGNLRAELEHLRESRIERDELLRRIACILESPSWRVTAPLRRFNIATGRGQRIVSSNYVDAEAARLRVVLHELESSRSWRLTQWMRDR